MLEKRVSIIDIRREDGRANARSITVAAIPNVHKPWRIGRLKPARAALTGSAWIGFRSPFSRYKSAALEELGPRWNDLGRV